MKNVLIRSLATLVAGFTLAASAQALNITARQPSLVLAPGASATAEFDVDFGSDPQAFSALQIELNYPFLELSADAETVMLSFASAEPQFSRGEFIRSNHDSGASITWLLNAGEVPVTAFGTAVLSMPLVNVAVPGLTTLTASFMLFTPADETLYQAASMDVITTSVPEPQAWLLALAGSGLLIGLRRRAS